MPAIKELSDCRVLVDAVQSFGLLPTELPRLGADLLTFSAHKIEGPKGVGCLAVAPGLRLARLWGGGDQESGRRAGTDHRTIAAATAALNRATAEFAARRMDRGLARALKGKRVDALT